jgi:hypothetical protein
MLSTPDYNLLCPAKAANLIDGRGEQEFFRVNVSVVADLV